PDVADLPVDTVHAAIGGLQSFADTLSSLIENALRGVTTPLIDAASIANALNGATIEGVAPTGQTAEADGGDGGEAEEGGAGLKIPPLTDVSQIADLAQIDDGGSVLQRLLGVNLTELLGSVSTMAELRTRLDALDGIDGNVTLTEAGGVSTIDLQ